MDSVRTSYTREGLRIGISYEGGRLDCLSAEVSSSRRGLEEGRPSTALPTLSVLSRWMWGTDAAEFGVMVSYRLLLPGANLEIRAGGTFSFTNFSFAVANEPRHPRCPRSGTSTSVEDESGSSTCCNLACNSGSLLTNSERCCSTLTHWFNISVISVLWWVCRWKWRKEADPVLRVSDKPCKCHIPNILFFILSYKEALLNQLRNEANSSTPCAWDRKRWVDETPRWSESRGNNPRIRLQVHPLYLHDVLGKACWL